MGTPTGSYAFAPSLACVVIMSLTLGSLAQERDRSKVPDKYKWNLADIYPSEEAWRRSKDTLTEQIPQLGQYRGKLSSSAGVLATALEKMSALNKDLDRLYVY